MTVEQERVKKRKVAWGITGAGDKIADFIEVMREVKKEHEGVVDIHVFVSKAGETVLRFYNLETAVRTNFEKVHVEINANAPFLAAWMQMRKYEFLLIAPTSSNSVAKIVSGIGDTMLTNAAIMSLKAFVPIFIAPVDYKEGVACTRLPNGKEMKIRVRREEVEQVNKLRQTEDVRVLESPEEISQLFKKWFCNS